MGLFKKKQKNKDNKLTPDMAGYRPEPDWWPDLTEYRKGIFLHNITYGEIDSLLKEYTDINSDSKPVVCDFAYTVFPDDQAWIYVEFPNFDNIPHYLNFWHYQNFMIWLGDKADKAFCLAIPKNQQQPLFLSALDQKNPNGDSTVGVYADRDFYFEVPGNIFEWGPIPTSEFPIMEYLSETFQFDTRWIPNITQSEWMRTQVTITVS